ncbi:hypothetical protein I4U23_012892 [Adineta vaga]|nr:hypothetical protein I4U23_012892 [Adineta vaga]
MDETTKDTSKVPPTTTAEGLRVCKTCGASAQYSYYGAIACRSCKTFFRRNAEKPSTSLKCNYNGNCEIDFNSRRTCSYCRLVKCFANGMSIDMIRAPQTAKHNKDENKTSTSTALVRINEPPLIPTLNLLRADLSTLSVDQWNQISNIVHSFDEYSGLPFIQNFMDEQNALPPKFRFKYTSVNNFYTLMMTNVQLSFEKNRDLLSISIHDRNTLLRHTVEYTTGIGVACVLRQTLLLDQPTFFESTELIFQPSAVALIKRLVNQLDPDIPLMKMTCAVVAFMISNYTNYSDISIDNLTNAKEIIRIQDVYTDLIWRYLLYKHSSHEAIVYFSNLIRCLFLVNDSVVEAHKARQYTDIMESVIGSTERKIISQS